VIVPKLIETMFHFLLAINPWIRRNIPTRLLVILSAGLLLIGCDAMTPRHIPALEDNSPVMQDVRARQDKIVLLTPLPMNRKKSVLLLLHGATADPTEMMEIAKAFSDKYNVLIYSYDFHQRIDKVATELAGELRTWVARDNKQAWWHSPVENMTVVTFSYSAAVFRKAVLVANDPALFSRVNLIQLVPTAGGSYLAREMGTNRLAGFISELSEPAAVQNPHGPIAGEIWGDEATMKFNEAIKPARVHSIILQDDPNSVAQLNDPAIQKRYRNGIGRNVMMVPKTAGVEHANFPLQPVAVDYLWTLLGPNPKHPARDSVATLWVPFPTDSH
jgi:hypothetical protein